MHAPTKPTDIPVITTADLTEFDGFLFGFSTRFGTYPAQFKAFWDATGGLWASGALHGKYFGIFVSTGSPNGGQEVSIRNSLSNFVHHGLIYVPLGYKNSFGQISNLEEVHGGSPWGAGAYAGGDGSRQFSDLELEIGFIQGKTFAETVIKAHGGAKTAASTESTDAATKTDDIETSTATVTPTEKAAPAVAPVAETKVAAPRTAQQKVDTAPKKEKSKKFCGICTIM
jgi:NAD(P)H dehydrogenase (quinone)